MDSSDKFKDEDMSLIKLEQPDPENMAQVNLQEVALRVPDNRQERLLFLKEQTRQIVRTYAQQCKQDGKKRNPLNAEDLQKLDLLLQALSNIEGLTTNMEKEIKLKFSLELIMDGIPKTAMYKFPEPLPRKAKAAWQKYEAENWGAGAEHELLDDDEDVKAEPSEATSPTSPTSPIYKPTNSSGIRLLRRPRPGHSIYGTQGIMRGILIDPYGKMRTYKFDDTFVRPSHKVFGHNGLEVGQWWPLQMCALRDGAHGTKMGGIAGSDNLGATSIVVSGGYADMDKDLGDVILYSGSNSHSNTDPNTPLISKDTKCLVRSYQRGCLVRVIRSASGASSISPSVGYRYEGLYRITAQQQRTNPNGGAYLRFRFERIEDQDPIDTSRPTAKEKRDYEKVRDGY